MKEISMRAVFAALCKELGPVSGPSVFEWYCETYKVTAADLAPSVVVWEVFGK